MKKILLFSIFLSAAVVYAQNTVAIKGKPYKADGRKVVVYTTADNTSYRLSPTDTVAFKRMGQPVETQICVFVDPTKTFQTILGIGGALTDASAETFYKLPKATQQEVMTAYFDKNKGI